MFEKIKRGQGWPIWEKYNFPIFYLVTGVFVVEGSVAGCYRLEVVEKVGHDFWQRKDHLELYPILVKVEYIRMVAPRK